MALIKCPECGKENVSDTAVACPGCGCNIQAHTNRVNQEIQKNAEREAAKQRTMVKEERSIAKKNDPIYQKKKWMAIVLVVIGIIVCIVSIFFTLDVKENKSYEKDLSSVFKIPLEASIEDIIEFEADMYGHTEYKQDNISDGEIIRLDFAPYVTNDGEIHYKHRYFFDADGEKLNSVEYGDIFTSENNKDVKCMHIFELKQRALQISSTWDENEYDGLFLTMHGQINGVQCRIRYQSGSVEGICLFIDN